MSKSRRAPGSLARLAATALACVLALGLAPASRAQLQVDITRGHLEPLPIAVLDFYGQSPVGRERGQDVAKVITADLERSGLFRPIDRRASSIRRARRARRQRACSRAMPIGARSTPRRS